MERIQLKVFVISLPSAETRRLFQHKQLTHLGLNYSIVDAVSVDDLVNIRSTISVDRWERALMPTEIACFHSHLMLWQKISHINEPALILEDDILLSDSLSIFLSYAKQFKDIDHITLETRLRKKLLGKQKILDSSISIRRLYQDRTGAAAYILWPSGASKLLNAAECNGAALADAFISNLHSLKSWQSIPALAIQSDVAEFYNVNSNLKTHSYIQANGRYHNYQPANYRLLIFKLRRFYGQLKLAGNFLINASKARRDYVYIDESTFISKV